MASGRTTSSSQSRRSFSSKRCAALDSLPHSSRRGFYEKDKATPVDPRKVPVFDDAKLAAFPAGYRFLAYGQSAAYKIKLDLPQTRGARPQLAHITWPEC